MPRVHCSLKVGFSHYRERTTARVKDKLRTVNVDIAIVEGGAFAVANSRLKSIHPFPGVGPSPACLTGREVYTLQL